MVFWVLVWFVGFLFVVLRCFCFVCGILGVGLLVRLGVVLAIDLFLGLSLLVGWWWVWVVRGLFFVFVVGSFDLVG